MYFGKSYVKVEKSNKYLPSKLFSKLVQEKYNLTVINKTVHKLQIKIDQLTE